MKHGTIHFPLDQRAIRCNHDVIFATVLDSWLLLTKWMQLFGDGPGLDKDATGVQASSVAHFNLIDGGRLKAGAANLLEVLHSAARARPSAFQVATLQRTSRALV